MHLAKLGTADGSRITASQYQNLDKVDSEVQKIREVKDLQEFACWTDNLLVRTVSANDQHLNDLKSLIYAGFHQKFEQNVRQLLQNAKLLADVGFLEQPSRELKETPERS